MKFIVAITLTALLGYAAPLYGPWWSFALTSFIVALAIHQKPLKAFIAGFAGLFLLWAVMAFYIDAANQQLLSKKVAQILPLAGSSILLIIISALIGGLVSALAAVTGSFARRLQASES